MWKIITKSGRPLTYDGKVALFPTQAMAKQYMREGDALDEVTPGTQASGR